MAVKTIGVKITGADEVQRLTSLVNNLQKSVVNVLKDIERLGAKSSKSPSFSIKVHIDEQSIYSQVKKIKGIIENEKITLNVQASSNGKDLAQGVRKVKEETDRLAESGEKVSIAYTESFDKIYEQVDKLSGALTNVLIKGHQLTVTNPAKTMLTTFMRLNTEIIKMNTNLGMSLGKGLLNGVSGVMHRIRAELSTVFNEVVKGSQDLGDAMQVYRVNMSSMGFSEQEVNKSMKRLGDYGKKTVYDASDLLSISSGLYAYDRSDAEDITKALAGLTAQTIDPVGKLKQVNTQLTQMMASGVLNQQDWKFMREAFSALGASDVIDKLTELAKAKGYNSIIDATRKRAISSDEMLDILKEVGGSQKFQDLVFSIITPRQALANLKESLSNLFVFDEIDENGNAVAGPLKNLYDSITEGIKGVTEITNSDKFREYVRRFGDGISAIIGHVNNFGTAWKNIWGSSFVQSLDNFFTQFSKGLSQGNAETSLNKFTQSIIDFLNAVGYNVGSFSAKSFDTIVGIGTSLSKIGKELVSGGILDGLSGVLDLYSNIAELGRQSGAFKAFAEQFNLFYSVLNNIITDRENSQAVGRLVTSLSDYIKVLFETIEQLGTKTNLIPTVLDTLGSIVDFFKNTLSKIKGRINASIINRLLANFKNAFDYLLGSLSDIYAELGSSVIKSLASSSGKNLLKAIANFFVEMNKAFRDFLATAGLGSVERGLNLILSIITTAINTVANIVSTLKGGTYAIPLAIMSIKKVHDFIKYIGESLLGMTDLLGSLGGTSGGILGVGKRGRAMFKINGEALASGLYKGTMTALASTVVNSLVQQSNQPQNFKDAVTGLSGAVSGSAIGAGIGSAILPGIGTLAGGVIGGTLGFLKGQADIKQQEQQRAELEAQAREIRKQELQYEIDYMKAIADQYRDLQDQLYQSITQDSSVESDLGNVAQFVTKLTSESGLSYENQLKQLGVSSTEAHDIDDKTSVNLLGKSYNWNELKEMLGLNDNELLATLKYYQSTLGKNTLSIVNGTTGVTQTIATMSDDTRKRVDEAQQQLSQFLSQNNITVNPEDIVLRKFQQASNQIKALMETDMSEADKAEAIKTELSKLDPAIATAIGSMTNSQILSFGENLLNTNTEAQATNEDLKRQAIEELKKVDGISKEKVAELIKKHADNGYEAIYGFVDELAKLYESSDNVADENEKLLALKAQVGHSLPQEVKEKQQKANAEYINNIASMLDAGAISVTEASQFMASVNFTEVGVKKDNLSKSGKALVKSLENKIDEGSGYLDLGKQEIDKSIPNHTHIEELRKRKESWVTKLTNWARETIDNLLPDFNEHPESSTPERPTYNRPQWSNNPSRRLKRASGGVVGSGYYGFSRGTDTVPALLTQGEYVLRKKAVESLGLGFLNNLNSQGVHALKGIGGTTIINNVYNTNNAKVSQNIDNKSQYLNGMLGLDRLMRYV